MRRALGLAMLALTGMLCPTPAGYATTPHCATVIVRSIAGTYCQTRMPNPYLDPDV